MSSAEPDTSYLNRPEGRIGYDVAGNGPLVVCAPGMGDLRSVYRFLRHGLLNAGYRVATMDLRGHGDSDITFTDYDDTAAGSDLVALVAELGGPAVLIGNSMAAGAAVLAAADAPDRVAGLVLVGPFVRDISVGVVARVALRLGLLRPWGPVVWNAYYARLYRGKRPADLEEHRVKIREAQRRPGYWRAFVTTTRTSHAPAAARLGDVRSPTIVVMGEKDPDFPDPGAEAEFIARCVGGEVVMVPGAGHYPQAEDPEVVTPAVIEFLDSVVGRR